MNRIDLAFRGDKKLLSIYFSAGHPNLDDTVTIIKALQFSGVDMIEIGLPFKSKYNIKPQLQIMVCRSNIQLSVDRNQKINY